MEAHWWLRRWGAGTDSHVSSVTHRLSAAALASSALLYHPKKSAWLAPCPQATQYFHPTSGCWNTVIRRPDAVVIVGFPRSDSCQLEQLVASAIRDGLPASVGQANPAA